MRRPMTVLSRASACAVLLACAAALAQPPPQQQQVRKDAPFVPTLPELVDEMLKLADVGKDDVVYDLGSGDGRLVIAAVKKFGAKRGVGIDIDPQRIKEGNANAQAAGVTDRVRFIEQDLFNADISEATVVTLYLLPEVNLRLRPKLWAELRPGTRVVSNAFDMGDWKYEKFTIFGEQPIYFWTIPKQPPAATR